MSIDSGVWAKSEPEARNPLWSPTAMTGPSAAVLLSTLAGSWIRSREAEAQIGILIMGFQCHKWQPNTVPHNTGLGL